MIRFSNFQKSANDPAAISIARYAPKYFTGDSYEALMPSNRLLHDHKHHIITRIQFIREYKNQLSLLNKQQVSNVTHITDLNGKILLCHCSKTNFCHRHIVRSWLSSGIETFEI
jgi:uncharacterized protein YeaO (DUF488 family)